MDKKTPPHDILLDFSFLLSVKRDGAVCNVGLSWKGKILFVRRIIAAYANRDAEREQG